MDAANWIGRWSMEEEKLRRRRKEEVGILEIEEEWAAGIETG